MGKRSNVTLLSMLAMIVMINMGCENTTIGNANIHTDWNRYPAINSFIEATGEKVPYFRPMWNALENNVEPNHVSKIVHYGKNTKDGYTINIIEGIEYSDTSVLRYWAFERSDTIYGYVEFDNGTKPWEIEVKLFHYNNGDLMELGKVSGVQGYAIYSGTFLNDSIVRTHWNYHPDDSTFTSLININNQNVPEVYYALSDYLQTPGFLNNNISPIPIEMIEEMAEEINNLKMDPNILSAIGSGLVGAALGFIYPGSLGCWLGGGASFVYGLINAYINGHK